MCILFGMMDVVEMVEIRVLYFPLKRKEAQYSWERTQNSLLLPCQACLYQSGVQSAQSVTKGRETNERQPSRQLELPALSTLETTDASYMMPERDG